MVAGRIAVGKRRWSFLRLQRSEKKIAVVAVWVSSTSIKGKGGLMRIELLVNSGMVHTYHSSEIRDLCLMKWLTLPYFYHKKTHVVFFILCYFIFFPNECPGLCQHEMKNENNYMGFLMIKIWPNLKHFSRALSWA